MKDKVKMKRVMQLLIAAVLVLTMIPYSAFAEVNPESDGTDKECCEITIDGFAKLSGAYYKPDGKEHDMEISTGTFQLEKDVSADIHLTASEDKVFTEIKVNGNKADAELNRNKAVFTVTPEEKTVISYSVRKAVSSFEADVKKVSFGSLMEGYMPETKAITLENTGDRTMYIRKPELKNFAVKFADKGEIFSADTEVLKAGQKCNLEVRPKKSLAPGAYKEKLVLEGVLENKGKTGPCCKEVIELSLKVKKGTFEITINKEKEDFGQLLENYNWSECRKFTVTNTGNAPIELKQPIAVNYYVHDLTRTRLEPGETSVFSLQPLFGIENGKYKETVTVYGHCRGEWVASDSLDVFMQIGETDVPEKDNTAEGEKENPSENPETGDSSGLPLFIMLAAGSTVLAAVLKKREKTE